MGIRLERRKPRHLLASIAYKINRLLPLTKERKLDLLLDLAWICHRLANENAGAAGLKTKKVNSFLLKGVKPTDRVLEIGCSSGRVLATIDAAVRVGVDTDKAAIEQGTAEHPDLLFVLGEARNYLRSAERFDVLILSHVLEHLDEPEVFLAGVKDSFDRIYVEVPDFDWTDLNEIRMIRHRQLVHMDNDHIAEFDREELETIFQALSMSIIGSEFRFGLMRYWLKPL